MVEGVTRAGCGVMGYADYTEGKRASRKEREGRKGRDAPVFSPGP
jgi:hypothetical protein